MKSDEHQPRADALDAIWLEDWERAKTLLLLAIVDELVAIAEYVNAADPPPIQPRHARP